MTADELEAWLAAARDVVPIAGRPCVDCPASWALQERAAGRCNGAPGRDDRSCAWCHRPIDPAGPIDARFCSSACEVAYMRPFRLVPRPDVVLATG